MKSNSYPSNCTNIALKYFSLITCLSTLKDYKTTFSIQSSPTAIRLSLSISHIFKQTYEEFLKLKSLVTTQFSSLHYEAVENKTSASLVAYHEKHKVTLSLTLGQMDTPQIEKS